MKGETKEHLLELLGLIQAELDEVIWFINKETEE